MAPLPPREQRLQYLDQLLARLMELQDEGRSFDIESLAADHPELIAELRQFLSQEQALSSAFRAASNSTQPHPDAVRMEPRPPGESGFGDYELLEIRGRGGMGVVYRAQQKSLPRTVALKMILARHSLSDQDVQRFRAEAAAVAQLGHPNIVPLYEFGQVDGEHYFTMEYIEGRSLAELVQEHPLPPPQAAAYVADVARGIDYAHQRQIFHRDLKPSNILIDGHGKARITDFGLAKSERIDPIISQTGAIIGTPSYMPPEQASGEGKNVTAASDVYGIGATLYHLLTGRPPFQAATALETVLQVLDRDPLPARRVNPAVPPDLDAICWKCLQKDVNKRYATAAELADDLEAFLAGRPVSARAPSLGEKLWKWSRRRPAWAAGLAAAAALLAAIIVGTIAARELQLRGVAEREREVAERETLRAAAAEQLSRRFLYFAQMNLANAALEESHVQRAVSLLEPYRVDAAQPDLLRVAPSDLRGFEWYHLWDRSHSDRFTFRHEDAVLALALSPDGTEMAAACSDGTVKLWNLATRTFRLSIDAHAGGALAAAISPDAQRLVTGGRDGLVKIWDFDTGELLESLEGHTQQVTAIAFHPDGILFATASYDRSIKVWRLADGQEVATLTGHQDRVTCLAFHPAGDLLASGAIDQTVKLWRLDSFQLLRETANGSGPILAVAFSLDGRRLATGSFDGTARLWDVESLDLVTESAHYGGNIMGIEFAPDGESLLIGGTDQACRLLDSNTFGEIAAYSGHTRAIRTVRFLPGGDQFLSAGTDGAVKLWEIRDRVPLQGHEHWVYSVACSPDGKQIASGSSDQTIRVWNAANGAVNVLRGHTGTVRTVAFLADDNLLAASGSARDEQGLRSGAANIWNVQTGALVSSLPAVPTLVQCMAVAPDGQHLALGFGQGRSEVHLYDVSDPANPRLQATWRAQEAGVTQMTFSPDGQWLAVAGLDSTLQLLETPTGNLLKTLRGHQGVPQGLAFSPDGRLLAAADNTGIVTLWDPVEAEPVLELRAGKGAVYAVAFSPDGSRLATAGTDRYVRVWNVESPQDVVVPPSGGDGPSPGGAAGLELLSLSGHREIIWDLAFSPDGEMLVSGSADHEIRLWRAPRKKN